MGLFVRKARTASGATAVQIASKSRGVRTIVEHVGSAHDDAQLAVLIAVARSRIDELTGQRSLDNDGLMPLPAVTKAPTVTGSRSRVLSEFGVPAPSLSTIWRTLARSITEDWRARAASAAFTQATAGGALTMVLYDVTTLYFEAEKEDALRRVGMSKERRVDPQILVGLLVDPGGFPMEVHAFEGNKAETKTLLPVLQAFQDRHQVTDLVVVADAGMLSAANLDALEDAGFRFIVGSRTSSAPHDLKPHFERHGNAFTDGQVIETTRTMGTGARARERRVHDPRRRGRRGRLPLPVPGRSIIQDGEDRPASPAHVRDDRGLHPSPPHDRVLRPRHQPAPARHHRLHDQTHRESTAAPPRR